MSSEPALPAGVPELWTYYAYLTAGCNLACRHCWLAPSYQPGGGTGGHLDPAVFARALDEAAPLGLKSVKFTGGEPLLHPDFMALAQDVRERGLKSWMETNGVLLTREVARQLRERTAMQQISVSLDGARAETHEYMRGVSGSFAAACGAVEHLVAEGYRPQVIMSLFPGNVGEIEELVRWAVAAGCGTVKFNLIQSTGRGARMTAGGQELPVERLVEIGRWVDGELQPRTPIPLLYSWPMAFQSLARLNARYGEVCNITHILGLLPGGEMALCGIGSVVPELSFGRIGEVSLRDVWIGHPILRHVREALPGELEGVCGRCLMRRQCLGECVAQNYSGAGRLTAPFWFCERALAEGLFPESRLHLLGERDTTESTTASRTACVEEERDEQEAV